MIEPAQIKNVYQMKSAKLCRENKRKRKDLYNMGFIRCLIVVVIILAFIQFLNGPNEK